MKTKKSREKGAAGQSGLLDRRDMLATLGALGPMLILGCGSSSGGSSDGGTSDLATSGNDLGGAGGSDAGANADAAPSSCAEIPDETGGPYPDIDGMISNSTYNRTDITEGKTGTPLTLTLQLIEVGNSCAPIVGARVIIWHCDANGVYSEYAGSMNSDPAQGESGSTTTTYLRGWQASDSNGNVKFTTIFPGWYTPRVTHIHVMVYNPSNLTTPVKTTQFTFTDSIISTVYAQATLYPKGQSSTTVASDMVFSGSDENLVAAVTGNTTSGYVATLPVGLTTY
jgi:protocatechuate 3,4-dioxygenase beta subunit